MLPAWFPRLYFHRQISYTYIEKHLWNMLDKSNQNPHTATSFHSNNYWKSKVLQTLFNYTTFRVRLRAAAFAASLAALRRSSPYGAVRRNLNLTFLPCERRSPRDGKSHTLLPFLTSNNRKANIFDTYSYTKSILSVKNEGGHSQPLTAKIDICFRWIRTWNPVRKINAYLIREISAVCAYGLHRSAIRGIVQLVHGFAWPFVV